MTGMTFPERSPRLPPAPGGDRRKSPLTDEGDGRDDGYTDDEALLRAFRAWAAA